MSYNVEKDSGMAKRKQYMHIPSGDFVSITQGSNDELDETRNYAQLVYQVNSTPISGNVSVGAVGLDGSGDVALSGDQLKVHDTELLAMITELVIPETYSRIVQTMGTDEYIAYAAPGSLSGDSVWRAQKIDSNGSKMWADGNTNFDNSASALSGLTYTY